MIHRDLNDAPRESGVYKLYSGETCIYVGSTQCLLKRFRSHRLRSVTDGWEWSFVPMDQLIEKEQALINELRPPMNRSPIAYRNGVPRGMRTPVTVSIEADLLAKLNQHAKTLGETRSVVVQRAIREGLKRAKWPPKEKSPRP